MAVPTQTPPNSPFAVQKKTPKGRRAFYFILLFFLLSFTGLIYASYSAFFKSRSPFVVFDIKNQSNTGERISLINPQLPSKQAVPEVEQASSLAEALANNLKPSDSRSKEKKTLEETLASAMLNYPEQKTVEDSANIKENTELPVAELPAVNVPATEAPAVGKTEEKNPPQIKNERIIDVKDEFALRKEPLPKPDLIKDTLMTSLPNFGAIKNAQSKGSIPLHIIEPLPDLQTASRYGNIPTKTKNGETPLQAYSRPYDGPPKTPYIAILVSGLGKRQNTTNAALYALPAEVSLSFSPYSEQLGNYVAEARRSGHETLLDLPMQQGFFPDTDPGPLGLVSGLPEQENRKRLQKTMGKNVAYIGLSASPDETFSFSSPQMKAFADEINDRGLIYIGGTENPNMPVFINTLRPDVYITDNFYRAAVRSRLEYARKIALKKGYAFVRTETAPVVLLSLLEWMNSFTPETEEQLPEITFVPVSYYAKEVLKNRK